MRKVDQKRLAQLIREADQAYHGGGYISEVFDLDTGEEREQEASATSDTLALFIGREIASVFEPGSSISKSRENVVNALDVAVQELKTVIARLEK